MSKKLTTELIKMRTKCDKLDAINKLNLWGSDIDDVSSLIHVPNLEIVSLSVNKIKTLKPFGSLQYLRELYLRKNSIHSLSELNYLKSCSYLSVLTLNENPVSQSKGYRNYIINALPQLKKLDELVITLEEREIADKDDGDYEDDEDDYNSNSNNNNVNNNNNINNYISSSKLGLEKRHSTNIHHPTKVDGIKYNSKGYNNNYSKDNSRDRSNEEEDEAYNVHYKNNAPYKKQNTNIDYNKNENNAYNDYDNRPIGGKSKNVSSTNVVMNKKKNYDNSSDDNKKNDDKNNKNYDKNFNNKNFNNKPAKVKRDKKADNENVINAITLLMKDLSVNDMNILKERLEIKIDNEGNSTDY